MTDPTPDEIARVEAWKKAQNYAQAQQRRAEQEAKAKRVQQRLHDALVGKTIERVVSDAEYEYERNGGWATETYEPLRIYFTDGSELELEGSYDSRAIDVDVHDMKAALSSHEGKRDA